MDKRFACFAWKGIFHLHRVTRRCHYAQAMQNHSAYEASLSIVLSLLVPIGVRSIVVFKFSCTAISLRYFKQQFQNWQAMPALRDVILRYVCHAWTSRYKAWRTARWLSMFFEHAGNAVRVWYLLWSGVEKPSGRAVAGRPREIKAENSWISKGFPMDFQWISN